MAAYGDRRTLTYSKKSIPLIGEQVCRVRPVFGTNPISVIAPPERTPILVPAKLTELILSVKYCH